MNDMATKAKAKSPEGRNFRYDVARIRADFPILERKVYDRPLVYLDNGASAQKPHQVLDAIRTAYAEEYSNVHRGAHFLSALATDRYEGARTTVARFLNAASEDEIVFTANATDAVNLVMASWGRSNLREGDEIVISEMEHHANIVPWQLLRDETGVTLRIAPIAEDGALDMAAFEELLSERTKLVAITHCSSVLGTVTPAAEIARLAHDAGAKVLFDGAQAAVHLPVDVRAIDADWYVFTGHKTYGPSGVGVLYGKLDLMNAMPPYRGGGEMIERVTFEKTTFKEAPHRFEAGTPPIVQAIGLGAALDYMDGVGREAIAAYEAELGEYAMVRLEEIEGMRLYGTAPGKAAIVSFNVDGVHPYDLATILDRAGIAVRVGQHCAEPLMDRLGVAGTVRASFGLYNTREDVDALVEGVARAKKMLS